MRLLGRPLRPRSAGLVLAALLACAVLPAQAASPSDGPTTTVRAPDPVDAYAAYAPQETCDPTTKPGAQAVLRLVMSHYGVGRNTGITRACSNGGRSEHKEGRAFDWGLSVDNAAEKAAGDAFTHWLTANGPDGRPGYHARRLGVMYVIWNRQIWMASSATTGWRTYYGASPHTDHVHVSLSWNGAYMRTSWWTGSLVAQAPVGSVDAITTTDSSLTVRGWGLDPDTSDPIGVHVYVDGVGAAVRADLSRPDVAAAYGRGDRHGFTHTVRAAPGPHRVCAFAIDSDPKGNSLLGCREVVVQDTAPVGQVDGVSTTTTSLTVSGWSLDPDTSTPTDVHLYVDGKGVAVRADRLRPDVGRAYGLGDQHGFSWTTPATPGRHEVCAYGINVNRGANSLLGCRTAQVPTAPPVGYVDGASGEFNGITVSGWSVDPDTSEPTDVHVYVNGRGTSVRADKPRPDVGAALRNGDRHGFTYFWPLPAGSHEVCVYGINTGPGPHTTLGCRRVTVVANATPVGTIDSVAVSAGTVSVSGWALDPDTVEPTDVHVYVDGRGAAVRADRSRPDVGTALGRGDRHGYGHTAAVAAGTHQVCVYAIDDRRVANALLGCRTVDVPA